MKDCENPIHVNPGQSPDNPRRFQFGIRTLFAVTTLLAFLMGMVKVFGPFVVGFMVLGVVVVILLNRKPEWAAIVFVSGLIILGLVVPAVNDSTGPGRRACCMNNLNNITMAVLQYEQVHGCFPPAYIADENGKPMHSWRVLILPYIGRRDLYEAYRFDEPWDGPNNQKLHNITINLFQCPSDNQHGGEPTTSYLAVVGPHVAWAGEKARTREEFTDGTGDTILLVESANSGIHWMEPRDINFPPVPTSCQKPPPNGKAGKGIVANHGGCTVASFVDGHQQSIDLDLTPEALKAILTIDGGEDTSKLDW